jgi:transcriptional regulator with XRE-family HTH domain
MKNELHELFQLAAKYFIKQYKKEGGAQSKLADELGITQSYLSSVINGSRSASLELYSQIAEKLYGPLDKFLAAGRRIKEGYDPLEEKQKPPEDPVENLIARLTYYVVDHQRIENELSELKQFYETIVENQPTGILVMDKNHIVVFANNYMNIMSHLPIDKIVGTSPFNAEKMIPGLDISTFREKYQEAVEQRQLVTFRNIKTKMPDGDGLFISGSLIPLLKEGLLDGMICTIYNTTTSHILRKLLINTLNFSDHAIGVVQQTAPGKFPKVYFKNNKFSKIFGLDDIDPSEVPFPEALKIMVSRMKNGKKWLDHVKKAISSNYADVQYTITMKNNKKYNWVSNPLIDDGSQWGRIVIVKEIKNTKKKIKK